MPYLHEISLTPLQTYVSVPGSTQGEVAHPTSLKLPAGALLPNVRYTFTLGATNTAGASTASASVDVFTNSNPSPGGLTVNPPTGRPLLDEFFLEATQWDDNDLPLVYAFGFARIGGARVYLRHMRSEQSTATTVLPSLRRRYSLRCLTTSMRWPS